MEAHEPSRVKFEPGKGIVKMGAAEELLRGMLEDPHLGDIVHMVIAAETKDGQVSINGCGSFVSGAGLAAVAMQAMADAVAHPDMEDDDEED